MTSLPAFLVENYADSVEIHGGAWRNGRRLTRFELVERLEMEIYEPPAPQLERNRVGSAAECVQTARVLQLVELCREALGDGA